MTTLAAHVAGVGLIGPGIASWPVAIAVLSGEVPYQGTPTVIPQVALLPAAERRRTGHMVRLALAAGLEAVRHAGLDPALLPTAFASSGSDGQNFHEICTTLASGERALSPTRFTNSVHNAAAGYWGIATGATAPTSVLCAYDGSFGAGLLEALTQVALEARPVLLVAHDTPYPEPMNSKRPLPDCLAVALVLAPERGAAGLGRVSAQLTSERASALADPALEALRAAIPAARCLPLLTLLAKRTPGAVVLDYLAGLQLHLTVS
jgi:hypothetical protein